MNREIKFRAWHKPSQRMYGPDVIAVAPNNGRFSEWTISGEGVTVRVDSDIWVLMQYTGIRDADDLPIYEGDICKFSTKIEKLNGVGVVSWSADGGYWRGVTRLPFLLHTATRIEYMGNIYETPELLEAQTE